MIVITPAPDAYVRIEVTKTGLMRGKKHIFEFPAYDGKASRNPNRYEITLDARSIVCKDDWLKPDDLKKVMAYTIKDVLDVGRYPTIEYKSESGILTMRGKSAPIGVAYSEPSPNVFEGSAAVDMRLFGIKPPSAALGAVGTEPVIRLSFRVKSREV